ncbi:LAMI_0H10792g1_1 [Lachancea mirantina]|uniref:LAMI_0H10792g1_1 n=1 Tax=Lachancea mirantina TaxID=1230905 RepID=A0A1G4KH65_9SACH|nr:LAMI_0H10792g1_1 [Lachancea mirantina]
MSSGDATPRLPLSKCKKIASMDAENVPMSQAARAATAFATELFVQTFTEQALARAQLTRQSKTRARVQYDDLAHCVATNEKFAFLGDVVPETKSLRTLVRDNRVRYSAATRGQTTLPFRNKDDPAAEAEELEENTEGRDSA